MSIINPDSNNVFKSASEMYSKVKRFLSSYNAANLIDEGEFPIYINEVLRSLGVGVYKESDAVLNVNNFKAPLPANFSILYAAYKVTPVFEGKDFVHQQGNPISVYNDVTWEVLDSGKNCDINCVANSDNKILERITVRQYVKEENVIMNFTSPILLSLSPNVKRNKCTDDCQNILGTSPFEITIDDGFLLTNFNKDCVYIKYYELAKDENGVPLIPDIKEVEKTIEWYIIYQLMLKWFINGEVPDLQNRWQLAEAEYNKYFAEAKFINRLPSFQNMINTVRRQRSSNIVKVIAQQV